VVFLAVHDWCPEGTMAPVPPRATQSQPEPARASQSQPEPARASQSQPEPARATQSHQVPKSLEASASASSSSSSGAAPKPKAKQKAQAAPASVQAEKGKAKQVISGLLQQSQNRLHALCRLMADTTRRHIVRIILGLGEHLALEHNMNCKVKTPDETIQYYADMAQSKWFGPLKLTMAKMSDAKFLRQAGFECDVGTSRLKGLTPDSAEVEAEDMMAARVWKIARCITEERVGSMCRHKTYPEQARTRTTAGQHREGRCREFRQGQN
jgi:hypothetical protein